MAIAAVVAGHGAVSQGWMVVIQRTIIAQSRKIGNHAITVRYSTAASRAWRFGGPAMRFDALRARFYNARVRLCRSFGRERAHCEGCVRVHARNDMLARLRSAVAGWKAEVAAAHQGLERQIATARADLAQLAETLTRRDEAALELGAAQ